MKKLVELVDELFDSGCGLFDLSCCAYVVDELVCGVEGIDAVPVSWVESVLSGDPSECLFFVAVVLEVMFLVDLCGFGFPDHLAVSPGRSARG